MSTSGESNPIAYAPPPGRPTSRVATWTRRLFLAAVVLGAFVLGLFASGPVRAWLDRDHASRAAASAPAGAAKQLWTCGMHPQVIQDHPGKCPICHMELTPLAGARAPSTRHSDAAAGPGVWIDPVVVQNMGVRLARVEKAPLRQDVRVVGYLREPDPAQRDVSLRVSGWIEKLHVETEGAEVKKGQPLFDLYSPDLQVAIYELITSRQGKTQAGGDAVTRRTADSLYQAARQKLLQWGLDPRQVDELSALDKAPASVPFLSPIDGHVVEKNVYEGSSVQAGQRVLRLADRSSLWLDAQVYERQLALVKPGQKVTAAVVALPGRTFEGEVAFIHPHLDPATRTAVVRVALPNHDHVLRQGMYATVDIAAEPAADALLVPREAVLDSGTRQVVFVALGEGHFEPRQVKLGPSGAGGVVQVLDGLSAGDQVVTSGQFLLDAESRLKEAIEKHLSQGLARQGPVAAATQAVATDDVARAYLKVADALGAPADDRAAPPVPVEALVEAATQLDPAIADAARALASTPRAEQRRLFKPLSERVIALLERTPPSKAVADFLFVVHCPMAFDNAGADWVQQTEAVANPYYATSMKACGSVQRQIRPAAQ